MIRVAVAVVVLILLWGVLLQGRWDVDCAATQPGTHWDSDAWACV